MRKTCCSRKADGDRLLQLARGLEVVAERLLDDHPHVGVLVAVQARLLERVVITPKYSGAVER